MNDLQSDTRYAYRAEPAGHTRGTVLVVHEIFGLTPHIRSVCDRLAAEGYLALGVNLYARQLDGGFLPYTEEGKMRGRALRDEAGETQMAQRIVALARANGGKVAVMGFCLGGTLAWLASADPAVACAIGYYSVGLRRHMSSTPLAPVLMHFGRHDHSIEQAEIQELHAAHPAVEIHEYDAGHAFNRDDGATYEPASAGRAWRRSLDFLAVHLDAGAEVAQA